MHQYDFNVPDEAKRHSDVDKKGCDEGMIGFADGEGEEQLTDEYPYTLWVYYTESGVNKAVADLMSTSIIPGRDTDTVYICYTDKETLGSVVRATYALNTAQ